MFIQHFLVLSGNWKEKIVKFRSLGDSRRDPFDIQSVEGQVLKITSKMTEKKQV